MSNQQNCPHCGAEKQVKPHDGYKPWRYDCGTLIHTGERLKAKCYERQIEQLKRALMMEIAAIIAEARGEVK